MSLTVAIEIIRAVDAAADVFPPLKSVTGGALFITETVKKFKRSKEDWIRLSHRIQTYVAIVMKLLQEDGSRKEDWTESLETLNSALTSIKAKIEDLQKQQRLKKWARYLSADRERVQDLQTEFDNAIQSCQFQLTLSSTSEVLEQLRGASARDIVEQLLRTYKQEIVYEIDWTAAFARLPDPVGTSWNPARACLHGTRTAHLDEIAAWISSATDNSGKTAEIYLVADALGSGKTTLAHAVCERAHEAGHLVASFFFNRLDIDRTTPRNLLGAIIRGLCDLDKQVKSLIAHRLDGNSTLATASPILQLKELILPICHILPKNRPLVIVIDALDEGYDKELLTILRDCILSLPPAFRIVITSRPEAEIMAFMHRPHIRRSSGSLTGASNLQDIEQYIHSELSKASWGDDISLELRKDFVERTQGLFLWATTVIKHVDNSFDPISEFQDLVQPMGTSWSENEGAEWKLDGLYLQILSKFNWSETKFRTAYKVVMGALVTLKEPLSLTAMSALYAKKGISTKTITAICSRMQSFLSGFNIDSPNQHICLLYLSIKEYLTTRAPSLYRLDTNEHHSILASCCLETMDEELTDDAIPQLGYMDGRWDTYHVPWIPKVDKASISEQLWYSCCFFADHILLVTAEGAGPSLAHMAGNMLSKNSRRLLEITTSMGKVTDLGAVRKWVLVPGLREQLNNAKNVDLRLASCLDVTSQCLGKIGRNEEALKVSNDAIEIYRHLSAGNSAAIEYKLSKALNTLSNCLAGLGRREDALTATKEAVRIRRHLAAVQPAKFEAGLSVSLNNLSVDLGDLGRHAEALAAIEEAIEIRRRLAAEQPTAFEPKLSESLNNLSNRLADFGRHEEALAISEEALEIRRRLAAAQPDAFKSAVARSLYNLSSRLSKLGRHAEALTTMQESVEIYRWLAEMQPAAFEVDLARSLGNLSVALRLLGRHMDALKAVEEDIEIVRRLAVHRPAIHNSNLAIQLHILSGCLVSLGRHKDAANATQEAKALFSQL